MAVELRIKFNGDEVGARAAAEWCCSFDPEISFDVEAGAVVLISAAKNERDLKAHWLAALINERGAAHLSDFRIAVLDRLGSS